jgi:transposase
MSDADLMATSALTENRMSGGRDRIELITRGERRRAWTLEQKREIAAESLSPGAVNAAIARKHGIVTSLLYTWRKQLLSGELGEVTAVVPSFLRIDVADEVESQGGPDGSRLTERLAPPLASRQAERPCGVIEIVLPSGISVRIDTQMDPRVLRCVLDALDGR